MRRRLLSAAVGLGMLLAGVGGPAFAGRVRPEMDAESRLFGQDGYIVRWHAGIPRELRGQLLAGRGLTIKRSIPGSQLDWVRLVGTRTELAAALEEDILARIESLPGVKFAEPNILRQLSVIPSDPRFGDQWGLRNTGQTVQGVAGTPGADIGAVTAWDLGVDPSSEVVGIMDAGIDFADPALAATRWRNPGEVAGNGIDDDRNGYIDDIQGWDFLQDDGDVTPAAGEDHGQHVAGIAAAPSDGVGTVGVAPGARLASLRVCDSNCSTAAIVEAMYYAGSVGIPVVNMSFGGPGASPAMDEAMTASSNTLFVAAAGNDGSDNDSVVDYPCGSPVPNMLCVAASDNRDLLPSWSNYGTTTVDVAAPGANILSTVFARDGADNLVVPFVDTFETARSWVKFGGPRLFERTTQFASRGSWSFSDSPWANYANNTNTWAESSPLDMRGLDNCALGYSFALNAEYGYDHFPVYMVGPSGDDFELLADWTGTTPSWMDDAMYIPGADGQNGMIFGMALLSDDSVTADGVFVDDFGVVCEQSSAGRAYLLDWKSGTSMASPMVAGGAALLRAACSACTPSEIKEIVVGTAERSSSFAGKVVSGGRFDLNAALVRAQGLSVLATHYYIEPGLSVDIELRGTGLGPGTQISLPDGVSETSRTIIGRGMRLGISASDQAAIGSFDIGVREPSTGEDAVCPSCLDVVEAGAMSACSIRQGVAARIGTSGFDRLVGTDGDEILCGLGGEDVLVGNGGDDLFLAWPGDEIDGGPGDDAVLLPQARGGTTLNLDGSFSAAGSSAKGTLDRVEGIIGGPGPDRLSYQLADWMDGGAGDDLLYGGSSGETLLGGAGSDVIDGRGGDDVIFGGPGDDRLIGGPGDDVLDGKMGRDVAHFPGNRAVSAHLGKRRATGWGTDLLLGIEDLRGGSGSDRLVGNGGSNRLMGEGGRDILIGLGRADTLLGGPGNDLLDGGAGRSDLLLGGPGDDELRGSDRQRDRRLDGGPGRDVCKRDRSDPVRGCERVLTS